MGFVSDTVKIKNFLEQGRKPIDKNTATKEEKKADANAYLKNLGIGLAGAGVKKIVQSDTAKNLAVDLANTVGKSMGMKKGGKVKRHKLIDRAAFSSGGQVMKLMPMPTPRRPPPPIMPFNQGGAVLDMPFIMKKGGKVKGKNVGNIDTVPSILAVNEIVIPRSIATTKKFKNYLTKNYNYNQKLGKFN